jgi:hypothetical protein
MNEHSDGERAVKLRAERDRAAAEGRPYALPMDCHLSWDVGAPLPTILQWEHEAHIIFYLRGDAEGVGTMRFDGCMASTFGPPGEDGHALEGSGWEAYSPLRVVNSPWPDRLFADPAGLSHFLLSFHDRTFECLAHSFEASHAAGTLKDVCQAVIGRWR